MSRDSLARGPARLALGVDPESPEALAMLSGQPVSAPYVQRTIDEPLRQRLAEASARSVVSLIVVAGRSKAGKTRTLLEAVASAIPEAWLIAPVDAGALAALARDGPPPEVSDGPCLVWLDDIEPFCRFGGDGLSLQILETLRQWGRPVVVAGTQGGKGIDIAGPDAVRYQEAISTLLAIRRPIRLPVTLNESELQGLERNSAFRGLRDRFRVEGVGEFLIAGPRLIDKLETGRHKPGAPESVEGIAVIKAAIDFRRSGVGDAVPAEALARLYVDYLPGTPSEKRLQEGLHWAALPLYSSVALLTRTEDGRFEPHDYVVDYVVRTSAWQIPGSVRSVVVEQYAEDHDLLLAGVLAVEAGDHPVAISAFSRADELGSAHGAFNLGLELQHDDPRAAEEAWLRADERGLAEGAFNVGEVLRARGDLAGAEAAFIRAEGRGLAVAANNLGVLLMARGDSDGAEAAYRRADDSGDSLGPTNLGRILLSRGERSSAAEAFRRADERGDPEGATELGRLLEADGDLAGAVAAYERADNRGDAVGANQLGTILMNQSNLHDAEAAFRRADARGNPTGAYNLGALLHSRGDQGAREAFARADSRGHNEGAYNLGVLLQKLGDNQSAEAAYERASSRGNPLAATNLAGMLLERDDRSGALAMYQRGDELGDALGAFRLGLLLVLAGDSRAADAFARATERGVEPASAFRACLRTGGEEKRRQQTLKGSSNDPALICVELGKAFEARDDLLGAEASYRCADQAGCPIGSFHLACFLILKKADIRGAKEPMARAATRASELPLEAKDVMAGWTNLFVKGQPD